MESIKNYLSSNSHFKDREIYDWSCTVGILRPNGEPMDDETAAPMSAIARFIGHKNPSIMFMRDLHTFFGSGPMVVVDPQLIRAIREAAHFFRTGNTP